MHMSEVNQQSLGAMAYARDWTPDMVRAEMDALKHKPGALLPILHAVQNRIGYIPEGAVAIIAEALQQTRAEVHGVISFYHHFRTHPVGSKVIHVCRAEACQAMGANDLADAAKARLGVDWHGTTTDGSVTLEPVYCLGLCACGPAALVDGVVVGRVDKARLDAILEEAGA